MNRSRQNAVVSSGVVGLHALYRRRAVTPSEALEAHLARAARLNPGLNALVHMSDELARRDAHAASQRWADGRPRGVLDGVPIAVKANIAVAGQPWTAALFGLRDRVATEDAVVVQRLREAGAVIVGIANMHEGALGATTTSPLYGQAYNPARAGFTPGGSSGGSAAAVAAGFCAGALGSDTLGSVRIPSAYCGVYGFKPSFGAVSRQGVELLSWSLDHVGFHGLEARDLAPIAKVAIAPDPDDPFGATVDLSAAPSSVAGLRLGRVRLEGVELEPSVLGAMEDSVDRLRQAGAEIVDVDLAGYDFARMRREGLLILEAEAAVAWASVLEQENGVSETLRGMISYGARQPAVRLAQAQWRMSSCALAARQAFAQCDALILPTAAHTAFPVEQAAPATQADLTTLANLAGLPAASVPAPVPPGSLPVGLQLIAPRGRDGFLLGLTEQVSAALRGDDLS